MFEEIVPVEAGVTDVVRLADAADAWIVGWPLLGGRAYGTAPIASLARGCERSRCSTLELTQKEIGGWTLRELSLFASAPIVMTYGDFSVEIERAAIRLYGAAPGVRDSTVHVVPDGRARFLISGATDGGPSTRWATNSAPIVLYEKNGGWFADRFELIHVDGSGAEWVITVPESTWE